VYVVDLFSCMCTLYHNSHICVYSRLILIYGKIVLIYVYMVDYFIYVNMLAYSHVCVYGRLTSENQPHIRLMNIHEY